MITLTDSDRSDSVAADTAAAPTSLTTHLQTIFAALSHQQQREDVPAAKLGAVARAMAVVDLFRQVSAQLPHELVDEADFTSAASWLAKWYHDAAANEQAPPQMRKQLDVVGAVWAEIVAATPTLKGSTFTDFGILKHTLIRILRLWTLAVRALVAASSQAPSPQHGLAALQLLNVVANEAAVMAVEWR